jgi:hypothetical protein
MKERFKIGKEWKRYSWTFKPENFKHLNFRYMRIKIFGGITKGSLWVDGVQLEEGGKESEYEALPLEFGASIDQPYKLYNVTELNDAAINLYFRNNSSKEADFKIKYRITDYWDKEVASGSVEEKVKADGNAKKLLKIPSDLPIGYYRVNFDSADGKLHDEAIFGIYKEMAYKGFLPFDWPLGYNKSEGNPIVRKLGFGWVRCWNFKFKDIWPEKDKLDFAKQDLIVKRCQDAKLNIMPVLGTSLARSKHHKDGNKFIPKWAIERTAKSSKKGSWALDVSFPRIDAWKAYVKALVSRYKDRIKVWEVMNEPNCWLIPEEYAPYMKATYEAAKEADPDCIIVGVCATSDWSGEPAPWTKRVLEIDGCKSLDALSIHMYGGCSPEAYRGIGTDGMLNHLKGMLKEFGRDIPIWHTEKSFNTTEVGYSPEKLNYPGVYLRESGFKVPNFRDKAEFMIRESLIDSTVGKGPYFWFGAISNDIYIMSNSNVYGLQHIEFDGSPCPELIAANGLARMLEGRQKPQELIKLGASIYCALYQGEKGTLAAVWDSEKKAELKIKSKDAPFNIYNFFGVQLPQSNDLKLTGCPLYLTFNGKKADEIKALLIDSEISGEKFTFSGGLELNDGTPGIAAYLFNRTMKNVKAELAVNGIPAQWKLPENEITQDCAANKYNRFFFPASLPESSSEPVKIKVYADKQSSELSLLPYNSLNELKAVLSATDKAEAFEAGKIIIDGDLSDWSEAGFCGAATAEKVKRGRENWKDAMDLSVEMRFRYDAECLYVAAKVYDNTFERNAPANRAYSSDSIELFIGLDPASKEAALKSSAVKNRTGKYDYQIILAPGMGSGKYTKATAWNCKLKNDGGMKIESKLFKYGYILEAAIPLDALKKDYKAEKGIKILVTFQAKDTDVRKEASNKAIFWTGDDYNWLNPQNWGELTLK